MPFSAGMQRNNTKSQHQKLLYIPVSSVTMGRISTFYQNAKINVLLFEIIQ
jgi:hypothetical protein